MKLKSIHTYLLFIGLLIASCNKDDSADLVTIKLVSFQFKEVSEAGQRVSEEGTPAKVRLSIFDKEGNSVHNEIILDLYVFGNGYVSESIELSTGSYQLTMFQILDKDGSVIMASPIGGSEKSQLVENPLPIDFVVSEDETTNIIPEVLLVNEGDDPTLFGYVNFGFNLVNNFSLEVAIISDYDSLYVPAEILFVAYDKDSVAFDASIHSYTEGIESTILDKSAHFYEIAISSPDAYHEVKYYLRTDYLTALETLALRLSPTEFTNKYNLVSSSQKYRNELNLYLPVDGCLSYARMDATGLTSEYMLISLGIYDQETGISLLLPNLVEYFGSDPRNLFFPSTSVGNSATNICTIISETYEENPSFEMDYIVIYASLESFYSFNIIWNSVNGEWSLE